MKKRQAQGIRPLSILFVLLLVSPVVMPAVNASDMRSGFEQNDDIWSGETAVIHFEGLTEKRIVPGKLYDTKVPSSIKKYDLVTFDSAKIKDYLLRGRQITVSLSGETYVMDLHELTIDTEAMNKGIHSFVGILIGDDNSEVVLTVSDRVTLGRIRINDQEFYIDSTSVEDPNSPGHYIEYTYSSQDIVPEGDTILIDSYSPVVGEISENVPLQKIDLEEQTNSLTTVTVRVLVATDSQWMTDEPDWQEKAADIIAECNYELNPIGVNLVPTYDTSKAQELSGDSEIVSSPFSTFVRHFPLSYLNSKNADFGIYLGGYDSSSNFLGSSGGYDSSSLNRHVWVQMADDPSTYDAVHKDRSVITLHEIGHVFDAAHQTAPQQTETYNRAYQFYEHNEYWQTVMWSYFLKSTWLEFSANDGFYGDVNHDNKRRISETKSTVASYC